jgi:hypothetical protein
MIATVEATRFWGSDPGNLPVCYYEIWLRGDLIRLGDKSAILVWVGTETPRHAILPR